MSARPHIDTATLKAAVAGHEEDVLRAIGVPWRGTGQHIKCPFPNHTDDHPSWRWDGKKAAAKDDKVGKK